ncbi:conserved hypothetical protein [Verticillium alfalfae VaMs.102]|uniref:Uncharacterized protein n=1 Tax=Verticillium alfalfae (strain VaMs.102 / ATCC MYA-4576 / FGSC 10136) TaxID=526221 RepID=C9SHS3_VERA1|nr:conserved hypothetical protein [Verticillium alfalfae VaMs.102]EEY18496.1 conserved hypothetical protein [Verticillium alfalfae VaMs.102]
MRPNPGPLWEENLHVSLDVTTNGEIPLPPYADDSPSGIFNITMFLSSYVTGRNFTISNGTATENNHTLGPIMLQEPGSTVKHVNWLFPRCLVGDGQPSGDDSDRGLYNISIRQNFRLNGEDHYTIFDVPVRLTNRIEARDDRPDCDALNNPLLSPEELDVNAANAVGIFAAPGGSTEIEVKPASEDGNGNGNGNGDFGELKPDARPGDGLGAAVRSAGAAAPAGYPWRDRMCSGHVRSDNFLWFLFFSVCTAEQFAALFVIPGGAVRCS